MDSDRDISSDHEDANETKTNISDHEDANERKTNISRHMSESSIAATEDEDDDADRKIDLGPQFTLKEQLEKDKVHSSFQHSFYIVPMFIIFVNCIHY